MMEGPWCRFRREARAREEATSQKEAAIIVRSDPRIGGRMLQVHVRKDDIRTAHAVDIPLSPLPEGAARLHLKLFGSPPTTSPTRQGVKAPMDGGTSSPGRQVGVSCLAGER